MHQLAKISEVVLLIVLLIKALNSIVDAHGSGCVDFWKHGTETLFLRNRVSKHEQQASYLMYDPRH